MRAIALGFVLCAALAGQAPPPLDIVLLVEDSIAATSFVRHPKLSTLRPGDRVAVMTFAGKQSLKLPFDTDPVKIDRVVSNLNSKGSQSTTRLWDAVVKATTLFDGDPSRRRAIVLVFAAEDKSSKQSAASIRSALKGSDASLNAVAVYGGPRVSKIPSISPVPNRTPAPNPPDVWDEGVPITPGKILPGETLRGVEMLAKETHGLVLANDWDFPKLAEYARTH